MIKYTFDNVQTPLDLVKRANPRWPKEKLQAYADQRAAKQLKRKAGKQKCTTCDKKEPTIIEKATNLWRAGEKVVVAVLSGKEILCDAQVQACRLEACASCEFRREGYEVCAVCGCKIQAKTALATESCPEGKWGAWEPSVETEHTVVLTKVELVSPADQVMREKICQACVHLDKETDICPKFCRCTGDQHKSGAVNVSCPEGKW